MRFFLSAEARAALDAALPIPCDWAFQREPPEGWRVLNEAYDELLLIHSRGAVAQFVKERGARLVQRTVLEGSEAVATIRAMGHPVSEEEPEDLPWDDATEFHGSPFRVRTLNEARLFVDAQHGEVLDTRIEDPQFQMLVRVPEGLRIFGFRLTYPNPHDPTDLGPGEIEILDPAELVLYAERVEGELPDPPGQARHHARRLRLAAAALRAAAQLIGLAHPPPPERFKSATTRRLLERDPARFDAARLLQESARLRELATRWDGIG